MDNNVNEQIMDKLKKVCICKNINRLTIKNAIKSGARTVEEVRKATGAGTGACKGNRCTYTIEKLLEEYSK
ncbi:(2Fe-2S)-binding protein [Clostridium botulinum]|uniref:(2Fe-2S)-binding protein n=3 Tax=Clostridium botulinum TaxID=1491 RepID=A0A2I4P442_CLOBO|nr:MULTISPECIES: (2Fe-2S)-binding protein [Clostridium]AJD26634.1 BFD-like [2Fe-2S] binding domain protein [Clostridium botulinum CDC_297]ACQ54542.1 [2Fe-2S]-binding domain protein [Clostridium botulinum Ba4 str. 657]AJE10539.1 BFD-like [2Fe-2S] binding domain protein [Clostridium botulinum CDC_1436]APR00331.1 BFD-like [2Fe-2S] binding domain protein [Clostridium botulinum]AUN02198.1 (2Fe-2S)-binding protein [Clostridium botulinum]